MTKEEIKAIRKSLGFTQTQMAEHLGCSKRCVVYYESGGRPIPKLVTKYLTPPT